MQILKCTYLGAPRIVGGAAVVKSMIPTANCSAMN